MTALSEPIPKGLLDGVRVLSFGAFVAGNTAAVLLAQLGAEVVKVESRDHSEVLRTPAYAIGPHVTEPSGAPTTVMYASLTRGLRNISLDLRTPQGSRIFHRLVGVCDVVIENFGSPVLERHGCGYRDLLAARPNLVMLSLSGYGRGGPRANYLAYGRTISSYLGLASSWGYAHGTLTDYVSGVTGALAAISALGEARRTGHPNFLDVAQIDAMAPMLAGIYAAPLNGGGDEASRYNRVPGSWLSGIFPARGHDRWLAVELEDAADWGAMCRFLGCPELEAASPEEAASFEPRLCAVLAEWAFRCSAPAAAHSLQRAGLAAVVVQDIDDIWFDPQLRARHVPEAVVQADLGEVHYSRSVQRWSDTPGGTSLPPARLGEHTRDVLGRWLGLSGRDLEDLESAGAVFSAPPPESPVSGACTA